MTILQIDSSITGDASISRQLTTAIVDRLAAANPGETIIRHDLAAQPLSHLTVEALGDHTIVDEFLAADTVVIGAPMYNFSVPTTLRSWFDHVLRAGETFRYSEAGPEGLLTGKKVIVVESRGGLYSEGPGQALDFQEPYLRQLLGFVGLTDVTFIRAEKIGYGPEARDQALADSRAELARLPA